MSMRPASVPWPTSLWVSVLGTEGMGNVNRAITATQATSQVYPAANRAHYFPIVIPSACTVYRFFWVNGATVGTNNFQVGIYNDNDSGTDGPGTSVLLGSSILSAGAQSAQFDNVADTPLYPGRYWLAIWGSGTTDTLRAVNPAKAFAGSVAGYIESALAGGLPATATPAQQTNAVYMPQFGFTTIASP